MDNMRLLYSKNFKTIIFLLYFKFYAKMNGMYNSIGIFTIQHLTIFISNDKFAILLKGTSSLLQA